jgi:hypothetical protein
MQKLFAKEGYERGDYLIRAGESFRIADGNGKAFVQMTRELAEDDKLSFAKITVVIVGVGGAGELAARAIIKERPARLILVDKLDKSKLAEEVGAEFYQGIDIVPDLTGERLVIIDATAHFEEGVQRCVALPLVEKYNGEANIFIDYNMHTGIGAYNYLKCRAGVGKEYVAVTNYVMVQEIIKAAKSLGVALTPVSREMFDQKVAESVEIRDKIRGLAEYGVH